MADRTFEADLEGMFGEFTPFGDADLFVLRVTSRLERGWTLRQMLIGGLGLLGGLIGGAQILGSGLLGRVDEVTTKSNHIVSARLADLAAAHVLPPGLALNVEALWMSAGLAVLAIGFALTRAIKQI